MTRILTFASGSRLLEFAPHPDDETLATGELIQLAIASGADVRVVFATDGDNNPWPQRWVERRWHLGAVERERWGRRRRSEAIAALAKLGLGAESARFVGWPDLGLTDLLERDDEAIDLLTAEIGTFLPTHVAMPSLRDRHPDHGALRVMVELALDKARSACVRLGYVVHGRTPKGADWLLPRDQMRQQRKREALMAHTSQTSLSERRLLRWANEQESSSNRTQWREKRRSRYFERAAHSADADIPLSATARNHRRARRRRRDRTRSHSFAAMDTSKHEAESR